MQKPVTLIKLIPTHALRIREGLDEKKESGKDHRDNLTVSPSISHSRKRTLMTRFNNGPDAGTPLRLEFVLWLLLLLGRPKSEGARHLPHSKAAAVWACLAKEGQSSPPNFVLTTLCSVARGNPPQKCSIAYCLSGIAYNESR